MSGYLNFDLTGDEKIDKIIRVLESASSGYHCTSEWNTKDEDSYEGKSYRELLQEAFDEAASKIIVGTE